VRRILLDSYRFRHRNDVALQLALLASPLLYLALPCSLFFLAKQVGIAFKHALCPMPRNLHTIFLGGASLPELMSSGAPLIMEKFADVLRVSPFFATPFLATSQALLFSIKPRNVDSVRITAISAMPAT